jgi:hypothetical protein
MMNKPLGCGTGMALVSHAFAQTRYAHAKTPYELLAARRFASIFRGISARRRFLLKALKMPRGHGGTALRKSRRKGRQATQNR